ncbi:ABC transporter permease [Oceanobacillus sp. CFH 90083]|uniref:ABC transporter permease n=1 Tax=Oceanobacillus sp. CFH 90083 TaxID=2592336 RepID=UPI00128B14BA|nr:ABC transporter permease [Oceanobacillus sp. CFH 90083]
MFAVFKSQLRKDIRSPWAIILLLTGSIVLSLIASGTNQTTQTTVPVFSDDGAVLEKWEPLLNENDQFAFVTGTEADAQANIRDGEVNMALQLFEDDYRILTGSNMPQLQILEDYVHTLFTTEAQLQASGTNQIDALRQAVQEYLESPPYQLQIEAVGGGEIPEYNMELQLLFGFTLFMAMFTIGFKVNEISAERTNGIWDRMILSPLTKMSMYLGHLLSSFFVGFLQIIIVLLIFQYFMDYDLGNSFGKIVFITALFTLSMVSVAMLFTGFMKTPEQFQIIYSSTIPIIPVLSGVYMPPGMLSNPILLFIADLFPLVHAVDSLMDIALYDISWSDLALPSALMLLIGVISMGIGVNLVERRNS